MEDNNDTQHAEQFECVSNVTIYFVVGCESRDGGTKTTIRAGGYRLSRSGALTFIRDKRVVAVFFKEQIYGFEATEIK